MTHCLAAAGIEKAKRMGPLYERVFCRAKWKVLHVPGRDRESILACNSADLCVPQIKMFPPTFAVRGLQFCRIPAPFGGGRSVEVQEVTGVIFYHKLKCSFRSGFALAVRQTLYPIASFSQRDRGQHALSSPSLKPGDALGVRVWLRRFCHNIGVEKICQVRGGQKCCRSGMSRPLSRSR